MKERKDSQEVRKALHGLRKTIRHEIKDPWGRVNCYVGLFLLAILALIVAKYFAGVFSAEVNIAGVHLKAAESGWRDALLVMFALVAAVTYWLFCIKTFVELTPRTKKQIKRGSKDV